jgi:hypothetical protein
MLARPKKLGSAPTSLGPGKLLDPCVLGLAWLPNLKKLGYAPTSLRSDKLANPMGLGSGNNATPKAFGCKKISNLIQTINDYYLENKHDLTCVDILYALMLNRNIIDEMILITLRNE